MSPDYAQPIQCPHCWEHLADNEWVFRNRVGVRCEYCMSWDEADGYQALHACEWAQDVREAG